jgi:hypothetical protein
MAKYKVTVEIQFELIERKVIVEANSWNEAQELGRQQVVNETESEDYGLAEIGDIGVAQCECIEPPSCDPSELVM